MPADLSPYPRRLSRKLTSDDDLDLRRARGELSCAECRRLKLKCDKKIPCGSCTRRGCQSACPNGNLSRGSNTSRPMVTDIAQLRSRITEMGNRIRQLEDALAILQSSVSSEPHALLRDELLGIKFGPEKCCINKEELQKDTADAIDAFGMLTIGEQGAKYYGPSAGSEALFMAGAEMDMAAVENDKVSRVSTEITGLSGFPFGTGESTEVSLHLILSHLPSQQRAWGLYEAYVEHAACMFRPLKRDEMVDEILSPVYKAMKDGQTSGSQAFESISPHKLAILFLVFALGALVDLTLEPYSAESEMYYHLGCACLSLRSIFDSPEIATVQALTLMGVFHAEGGRNLGTDSAWALMSLGVRLAQSIGLHRDGVKFGMDAKTVERRRSLFWELFSSETFYNLQLGRPPSIRLSYVDCQLPEDDGATIDENGNAVAGFYRWKYEFIKEIFAEVAETILTAQSPPYRAILELDRKVREKPLPNHFRNFLGSEECSPSVYTQKCMLWHYRAITLMFIHRSFFTQAVFDNPDNPLASTYAPSFLSAYRSASGAIKATAYHFERFPGLLPRVWSVWTSLFPAAIIVGCIVTRSPSSSVASNAFVDLGLVCNLFEKGAIHCPRARDGLAILNKLKEKATRAYSKYQAGDLTSNETSVPGKPDELAMFGARTRVVVSKLLSYRRPIRSQSKPASPNFLGQSGPHDDSFLASPEQTAPIHPSKLMEYLSTFPVGNSPNVSHPPDHDNQHDIHLLSTLPQGCVAEKDCDMQHYWQSPPTTFTIPASPPFDSSSSQNSFSPPFTPVDGTQPEFGLPQLKSSFNETNFFDPVSGMMLTSDSVDQWTSFMQDVELLAGSMQGPGLYDVIPSV